jgi:hypothetical protein
MTKMTPVESSTIKAIGYDVLNRELHVDFHGTGSYIYSNVPIQKASSLLNADSHGKHLNQIIKGQHPHRKK